jgi:hypothetical protein
VDIQNHFYSHVVALALYCGQRRPRHVRGLIQHGWTSVSPLGVHFGDFPSVGTTPRRDLFVWSHASRGWSPDEVGRRTVAIGSPWCYLDLATRTATPPRADGPGDVLCFPFHGTRLMRVVGDHARLAAEVADREGPVTVCLHHEDLLDEAVVTAWSGAGHRLATAGSRSDPLFLLRLMGAMRSARRVVSNRLTTSVMYAAGLGLETAVYGDPLVLEATQGNAVDRVERLWPELHGETTDTVEATELARRELGFQHVRTPDELSRLLGWTSLSIGPAYDYWLGAPVGKALRVLGLAKRATGDDEIPVAGFSPLAWLRHPLSHLPARLPRELPDARRLPWLLPAEDPTVNVAGRGGGPGR